MAAPTGYSVQVAQGTGLGPNAQGPVPTGQTPTSFDPNALPPVVPTAPSFPASTGTVGTPKGSGTPPSFPVAPSNNKPAANDLFDEPDIFIPGPAPAPAAATSKNDVDDEDDNNDENGGGGGGEMSDSYANLAARFSSLQK